MTASKSLSNYCMYKTKNHEDSVNAQFQNGAVTVSLALLSIKTANKVIMDNSEQITFQLPYVQDQKSLMLR